LRPFSVLSRLDPARRRSLRVFPGRASNRDRSRQGQGEDPVQLEKFDVTGSKIDGLNNKTIFRTDEKAALPFNVISREEIDHMGATNIQEVFRALPQVTNYGFSTQKNVSMAQTIGGDTLSNDSAGLRGFSNSQTVILVNGRRINGVLALENISSFAADISRFPVAMIDRIEVLRLQRPPSTARRDRRRDQHYPAEGFNARKSPAYYGTSTEGGGAEYHLTYLRGFTFGNGKDHLTVTLDTFIGYSRARREITSRSLSFDASDERNRA